MPHGQLDLFDPTLVYPPVARQRRPRRRNELLDVAALSLTVCRRYLDDHSCPEGRHTFTQPQLLSCLILRAFCKRTYRAASSTCCKPATPCGGRWGSAGRRGPHDAQGLLRPRRHARPPGPAGGREVLALLRERGLAVGELAVDSTGAWKPPAPAFTFVPGPRGRATPT